MGKIWGLTAMLAVAVALTGCASAQPATVKGSIDVPSGLQHRTDGEGCKPADGYADVDHGAQVRVTDSAGKVLGTGTLGWGAKAGDMQPYNGDAYAFPCRFAFTVDVPGGQGTYQVEVAHRGAVAFQEKELGDVALSLGLN